MGLLIFVAALVALGVAGLTVGVDSRDGRDWGSYLSRGNHPGAGPGTKGGTAEDTSAGCTR
jgi:hypothetical protein